MLPATVRNSQAARVAGGVLITAAVIALAPWRVSAQPARPASAPSGLASVPRSTPRARAAKRTATRRKATVAAKTASAAAKAVSPKAATPPAPAIAPRKTTAPRLVATAKPPVTTVKPTPKPEANASKAATDAYLLQLRDAYEARFLIRPAVELAAPAGPEGDPDARSGFRATGITAGPYTALIADLPPSELLAFLNADRQAARTLEEVTRARVEIGEATRAELILLEVKVRQLEILVAAAERLAARPKNQGRADLFRALTSRELVNYLAVEVNATRQLHELLQSQFRAGLIPATEVIRLTARLEQLEILLRAAERWLAPVKGGK